MNQLRMIKKRENSMVKWKGMLECICIYFFYSTSRTIDIVVNRYCERIRQSEFGNGYYHAIW